MQQKRVRNGGSVPITGGIHRGLSNHNGKAEHAGVNASKNIQDALTSKYKNTKSFRGGRGTRRRWRRGVNTRFHRLFSHASDATPAPLNFHNQ